jgi:hypothetical protein
MSVAEHSAVHAHLTVTEYAELHADQTVTEAGEESLADAEQRLKNFATMKGNT